jgi:hypothetical protein
MSKGVYAIPASIAVLSLILFAGPANALSEKECSTKYQSAKEAGTLRGAKWNEFRKAECGPDASMQLKTVNVAPAAGGAGPSIEECSVRYQSAKAANTLGNLTWNEFRKAGCPANAATEAVRPKEATVQRAPAESAKVSERECSARYRRAKEAGTLGGMKWNEFREGGCPDQAAAATMPIPTEQPAPSPTAESGNGANVKVSERECSARYRAAKEAGTLGELTWNEFRKGGCPTTTANAAGSMVPTMGSIFPAGIAPKYAAMHAGKARRRTCLDQYRANKAAGITQAKWTKKGGGYYSECNKRLKRQY